MHKTDPRVIFGAIILTGYVLCVGTLCWHVVPMENRELVAGAVGTLGAAVGMIVQALWRPSQAAPPPADDGRPQ